MVTRTFGRVIVAWHGAEDPADDEWEAFLTHLRRADLATARGFVLTSGGKPTSSQRRALSELVGVRAVPVSVVSDQIAVRFVASLLAMMTKRIRTFAPAELRAAFAHLELTPDEQRAIEGFIAEVGLPGQRR